MSRACEGLSLWCQYNYAYFNLFSENKANILKKKEKEREDSKKEILDDIKSSNNQWGYRGGRGNQGGRGNWGGRGNRGNRGRGGRDNFLKKY